jgi:uncharacterized protein (DUF305 family)
VVAGAVYLLPQAPMEQSAEVGFARDICTHHAQAVAMAEMIRNRTDDPELRALAADSALTQQGQIGMMSAWLDGWRRTQTSTGPSMAWMGMATTSPMPRTASSADLRALQTLPLDAAEEQFLRLMIAHDANGVAMAEAGAELAAEPDVTAVASTIAAAQISEIEYLQSLRTARGASPATVPEVTPMGHGAPGHHGVGSAPSSQDVLLLKVVTLGEFQRRAGSEASGLDREAAAAQPKRVTSCSRHRRIRRLRSTTSLAAMAVGGGVGGADLCRPR